MAFDPNTGLPWGINPFKVTSRETYEPPLPPSQFNIGHSSTGLSSSLNLPYSNFPQYGQNFPLDFDSSIDPMVLNPPPSMSSWPGPQQPFDFSLFHGAGREEAHDANAMYTNTLFPNLSASYDSFSPAGCLENAPAGDISSEDVKVNPIEFTSTDLDCLLNKMNAVGMLPSKCVTPPPSGDIKVPSTPRKKKPCSSGCSPAIKPNCFGSPIQPSPSPQHRSIYDFSSDISLISPKTSITASHTDISPFSNILTRYNNPFLNSSTPPSTLAHSSSSAHVSVLADTPQKRRSSSTQIGKKRRQTSGTSPSPERKEKERQFRNKSMPSTPTKPARKPSANSASNPGLGSAIFVNFTARDSKKLLNGVAPSGSSKRKKAAEGNGPKASNQITPSTSDDPVKKRRLVSSTT
ncbi:hypothetical protein PCANC_03768 [Puccinia coronata f. sp. avenae]|uniref:Developmental regulatory protein wetA n=1 Tax=Puccinia coronata f. sp. avenae TaxID=200324 RepID=A0A2N5SVG2_9BASI|nr:hypothetical protein PCASD_16490 [Puccinia coronata f. sp. avenae]PLW53915.1 hypothetical protein PCANC_03768 [Puccinia coronata f. sp. avenae]